MRKLISLVLAVSLFATLFAGLSVFAAADNTYVFQLADETIEYHDADGTASDDGAYVSIIGDGADVWMAIHNVSIPSDYSVMTVKYAGSVSAVVASNHHYVATDGGLGWGQDGSWYHPTYTFNNAWQLMVIDVKTGFTGVKNDNITDVRLLCPTGEMRVAYIGFFKSEADAKAYDAEYTGKYTLENIPLPPREEKVPDAADKAPEVNDFDDIGWTFAPATQNGAEVEDGVLTMIDFSQVFYDGRWLGGSEISLTLLPSRVEGKNFVGFYVRLGDEGTNPFYENDGVRPDSGLSTTGTTGIGFSFRPENGIEIFVKALDSDGNLTVVGYTFEDVVENISDKHTYKVLDDGVSTVKFYADGELFAQVKYSDAKLPESAKYSEKYYTKAVIMDAEGNTLESVANALISTQSTIAFGTRANTLVVDEVSIKPYEDPDAKPIDPSDPSMPSDPSDPSDKPGSNPVTGDSAITSFVLLLMGAAVVFTVAVVMKKKSYER